MKFCVPEQILGQHIAILGKTGSGKTSTEKLLVEHVVASDFRVCVLDTIKSDWWGITSSGDGKKPGLDFKILGGPRGHVPLHANAGKVIGQLVGSGKLRHSIIDMADFEAGGIQKFFTDFAPSLMRNAKGVLYLVIEEAHELAPKERAGFGSENLAIHWAKKLATAGRSKGIRLIVATQRVQSLHNAVLGSCETIIAHRLTTPADQEPVVKWLRANTTKETTDQVAGSLSSLQTGTGWVCSGEIKFFNHVVFPKFSTYDNTSTPTGDSVEVDVKTTPVDQEELRLIIGDAVKEAIANDPNELRKRIRELEKQLAASPKLKEKEVPALSKEEHKRIVALVESYDSIDQMMVKVGASLDELKTTVAATRSEAVFFKTLLKDRLKPTAHIQINPPTSGVKRQIQNVISAGSFNPSPNGAGLGKCERSILAVLAQYPQGRDSSQVAILSGYSSGSGGFNNALSNLRSRGFITRNNPMQITQDGLVALGDYEPLPTGDDLIRYWYGKLGLCERKILETLVGCYPDGMTSELIAESSGYSAGSGGFNNSLSRLRTLELITRDRPIKASDHLFQ